MSLSAFSRELGKVGYGLLWVGAIGAVLLWPVARFSGLISEPRLQYLAWVGWGVLALGFATLLLDVRAGKAIWAYNMEVQQGQPFRLPRRWLPDLRLLFAPQFGGAVLGTLRVVAFVEFLVQLLSVPKYGPPPSLLQIAFCAVGMNTLLAMRALAGPVFDETRAERQSG